MAVEPPKAGSSKKRSSRASIALAIGIPIAAIFTALIVGIYCIKQRKSSMHKGIMVIFFISNVVLSNKLVTMLQFLVNSKC